MADGDHNGIMEVVSHGLVSDHGETVTIVAGDIGGQAEDEVCEEDILQQAFDEASETFPAGSVQYAMMDTQIVNSVGEGVTFITENGEVAAPEGELDGNFQTTTYRVIGTVPNGENLTFPVDTDVANSADPGIQLSGQLEQEVMNDMVTERNETTMESIVQSQSPNANPVQQNIPDTQQSASGPVATTSGLSVSLLNNTPTTKAPLGSSQNPIRIIQQGNQYTPVQHLSSEQLQQIMQVVQQQQVKTGSESGSCVLFNPQTNTRIVYRVIYPTELHKGQDEDGAKQSQGQQTVFLQTTPKRVYKKRSKDEDERIEGPELSKEEKEQRKKLRPKTRSGRVSKPPKHMVQDYKHIHVLDFDEDYDDSDGGYSDFRLSDEEGGEMKKPRRDEEVYMNAVVGTVKAKKWKCETCSKAYIGQAGLARHYKLYPSHGKVEGMEGESPSVVRSESDMTLPGMSETPNGVNSTASLSEDSRDSTSSLSFTPLTRPTHRPRGRSRGRPPARGRGAAYRNYPEGRRKMKLTEIVKECTDEELMEIVLPRLSQVISLWEFLLMKVEKGNPAKPHVEDIYREYEKIHQDVRKTCQDCLQPVLETDTENTDANFFQIDNSVVAESLGLKTGQHKVKEIPDNDNHYLHSYKLLTTDSVIREGVTSRSFLKRTVEVVPHEAIITPTKKPRTVNTELRPLVNSHGSTSISVPTSSVSSTSSAVVKFLPGGQSSSVLKQGSQGTVPVSVHVVSGNVNSVASNNQGTAVGSTASDSPQKLLQTFSSGGLVTTSSKLAYSAVTAAAADEVTNVSSAVTAGKPSFSKPVSLLATSPIKQLVSSASHHRQQPQTFYIMAGGTTGSNIVTLSNSVSQSSNILTLSDNAPQTASIVSNNALQSTNILTIGNNVSQSSGQSTAQLIVSPGTKVTANSFIPPASATATTTYSLAPSGMSLLTNLNATSLLTKGASSTGPNTSRTVSKSDPPGSSLASGVPSSVSTVTTSTDVLSSSEQIFEENSSARNVLYAITKEGETVDISVTDDNSSLNEQANSIVTVNSLQSVASDLPNGGIQLISTKPEYTEQDPILSTSKMLVKEETDAENKTSVPVDQAILTAEEAAGADDHENSGSDGLVYTAVPGTSLVPSTAAAGMTIEEDAEDRFVVQADSGLPVEDSQPAGSLGEETGQTLVLEPGQVLTQGYSEDGQDLIGVMNDDGSPPGEAQQEGAMATILPGEELEEQQLIQLEDGRMVEGEVEAVQIPATNIYQTAEGIIIIQNADGSTVQLQGSDGQSIPIETVQALLAMDGETQFITQQTDEQ